MPLQVEGGRVLALGSTHTSNMMGSVRRARGLSDIAPQYIAKSGLCNASELESSRGGSIRIQHVTSAPNPVEGRSRFPKLDECAHFHYEHVEIGPLQVSIVDEDDLKPLSSEPEDGKWWSLSVTSQNKTWLVRRSYDNFRMLDQQLHRCIYDRKFSGLVELPAECIEEQENMHKLLSDYVARFSIIAGSLINCGPVLNWLELDNRGHRLLVPDTDNCPINTPAVAAAYSVKRYTAQAPDEISFEVGDMISVIDMPPPEESIWWRGKRGFQVGFFPCECVAVIGDKVPRNLHISTQNSQPSKPVLRKHGKLIAFFRSFILSRPSRRRLKQSGILKERVFGCDLGEHLLNSGHEIPMVLKCCAEFIETHGIVDGIYRLSGVTSNIQKLRNAFDEDRVPGLYEDEAILQDIHSVASLLKMYFRELPNPLCTYQLYHQFVGAVQATQGDDTRLHKMRDAVQKLPPPHYRTLEYLMRHLARVAEKGHETGMTPRNVAIVWAPNLLRCKELEVGGVAALQGVGVQAVVTEFLVCYTDLIFCERLPNISLPPQQVSNKKSRPKSLAISTPTKLLSLEEARTRALLQAAGKAEQDYIEVGGGPASLPAKYHTIIELPGGSRKRPGSKRSPLGWKMLFGKSGRNSQSRKETQQRKASTPSDLGLTTEKAVTESDIAQSRRRLRPAKSVESLNSSRNSATLDLTEPPPGGLSSPEDTLSPMLLRSNDNKNNGHNRSVSHESYFDQLQDQQDEETFESNLDISEIQVNFDLEESEMRIFSEDETLVSMGSGSLVSNSSPRILPGHKFNKALANNVSKRLSYPKLARGEDSLSSSQSADPSPKKQKTNEGIAKRSRLEEQLTSSAGDIQFIDSVSPDQVLVHAEVHPIQSPSPVSSISQISSSILPPSSPILPHIPHLQRAPLSHRSSINNNSNYNGSSNNSNNNNHNDNGDHSKSHPLSNRTNASPDSYGANHANRPLSTLSNETYLTSPSLAEATISDNESFSLQSSELTTPDTPQCGAYTPLLDFEESSVSNTTTPDFDGTEKTRKYSSDAENLDKTMAKVNLEFDRHKNIGKEYERFEEKIIRISSENICMDLKSKYENVTPDMVKLEKTKPHEVSPPKPEERKQRPFHQYENIPVHRPEAESRKSNVVLETSFDSRIKSDKKSQGNRDSVISIKYECISTESSCDSLINFNKTEENRSLLTMRSNNPSPVVESVETSWLESKPAEADVNLIKDSDNVNECDLIVLPDSGVVDISNPYDSTCNWVVQQHTQLQEPETQSSIVETTDWQEKSQSEASIIHFANDANLIEDSDHCASFEEVKYNQVNVIEDNTHIKNNKSKATDEEQVAYCDSRSDNISDNIPSFEYIFEDNKNLDKTGEERNEVEIVDEVFKSIAEDKSIEGEEAKAAKETSETEVIVPVESGEVEVVNELVSILESKCEVQEQERDKQPVLETAFDQPNDTDKPFEQSNDIEVTLRSLAKSPKRTPKTEVKVSPKKKVSPQKSSSSGNVRQLLSKFEISPTTERDLLDLKLDFDRYKKKSDVQTRTRYSHEGEIPTMRRSSIEERPKTIERISTRRKTEREKMELPESNLGKSKSGSQIHEKEADVNNKIDVLLNSDLDLSDPQRRERIERYKEKRRTYLREKYRSDSFKCDKDDFALKLKQTHVNKTSTEDVASRESPETVKRLPPFEKPARKHLPIKSQIPTTEKKTPEKRNPPFEKPARKNATSKMIDPLSRDLSKKSSTSDAAGKFKFEGSAVSSSSRESSNGKTSFVRLTYERRSAGDFRSPKSSPEKKLSLDFSSTESSVEGKLSPEVLVPYSPRRKLSQSQESGAAGRSSTDSGVSCESSRTKSVEDSRCSVDSSSDKLPSEGSTSGCTTPSYCIRDMAALFERREDGSSQVGSHKQYLSSV